MFKFIIIAIILIFVIGIILIARDFKNAPIVDDKEPFLWDDYKPKK